MIRYELGLIDEHSDVPRNNTSQCVPALNASINHFLLLTRWTHCVKLAVRSQMLPEVGRVGFNFTLNDYNVSLGVKIESPFIHLFTCVITGVESGALRHYSGLSQLCGFICKDYRKFVSGYSWFCLTETRLSGSGCSV